MNEELTSIYIDVLTGHLHKTLNELISLQATHTFNQKEGDVKVGVIDTLNDQTKMLLGKIEELEKTLKHNENVIPDITNESNTWRQKFDHATQEISNYHNNTQALKDQINTLGNDVNNQAEQVVILKNNLDFQLI